METPPTRCPFSLNPVRDFLYEEEAKVKKVRVKKEPEDTSWRPRYAAAHKEWYKTEYPNAWKDNYYTEPDYPDTRTANGLQNAISNHMKWTGGIGNRINNIGIAGRKSTTINGTADMDLQYYNGRTAKAEVKVGKDRPSPEQLKMQARVRKAKGVYEFIKNMHDHYKLFDLMTCENELF